MNENFEYNESNVVFRDLILLTLTGFMSMVILLMPFIQPPSETENSSVPPGNVIVELFWDNDRDVDIDLWVKAPEDIPVGYSNQGGLFFNLLRDDLGKYKDSTLLITKFLTLEELTKVYTLQIYTFTERMKQWFQSLRN